MTDGDHGTCHVRYWGLRDVPGPYAFDVTFARITVEPDKMAGRPCIRGLRIPIATAVGMAADGMTPAEIVTDLPELEMEDVAEALRDAADALRERQLSLRHPA
jgi:uncharacterized protein (DUF433 family)